MPKGPQGQKRLAQYRSGIVGAISGVIVATIASKLAHPLAPINFVIYVLVGAMVGMTARLLVKYWGQSENT